MRQRIAIIYNDPADPNRYGMMGEERAILGVLDEVEAVYQALEGLGFFVERVPISPPLESAKEKLKRLKVDLVFNLFEGFGGRPETEAALAYLLSGFGLPHTGCPAAALALALDKAKVKSVLSKVGIPTPTGQLLDPLSLGEFSLRYPCIVKPSSEDASHGIYSQSVVYDAVSLEKQVLKISGLFGGKVLVEEYIDGHEFNVTVMGKDELQVLPPSEIVYSLPPENPKILTFSAKWDAQSIEFKGSQNVCPALIDESLRNEIALIAIAAYRRLGCAGYARVDFRQDAGGNLFVIDINPNPDIAPDSGVAKQVKAAGMTYTQFIERIVSGIIKSENRYQTLCAR